jgi:iron-sulfur cluster repair protein YtfE (RIC family)
LFEVFTKKIVASNEFAKIIDAANVNERESMELLDQIINYWLEIYHKDHNENLISVVNKLQNAQLQPPMPGSSVTFWRNLYLQTCDRLQ